jgi:hypothetical protein
MKRALTIASGLLAGFAADAAGLDRQDLEKKLQDLAKAPAPANLAPGAMCYSTALPPASHEYYCPKCGEKTLYSRDTRKDEAQFWDVRSADYYRRSVKQLQEKGLNCKLDETAFCQKCGKDAKTRHFVLETRWPGQEKPHRAMLQGPIDLQILQEFLSGKDRHDAGGRGEEPLKDYLPRLRELLGLDTAKPEEKKTP